jgi:hypothetical protein
LCTLVCNHLDAYQEKFTFAKISDGLNIVKIFILQKISLKFQQGIIVVINIINKAVAKSPELIYICGQFLPTELVKNT